MSKAINLKDCTKHTMATIDERVKFVIEKVGPTLCDFALYEKAGEVIDIDFFEKDDSTWAFGLSSLDSDSELYAQLFTVETILVACLGLKWEWEEE